MKKLSVLLFLMLLITPISVGAMEPGAMGDMLGSMFIGVFIILVLLILGFLILLEPMVFLLGRQGLNVAIIAGIGNVVALGFAVLSMYTISSSLFLGVLAGLLMIVALIGKSYIIRKQKEGAFPVALLFSGILGLIYLIQILIRF